MSFVTNKPSSNQTATKPVSNKTGYTKPFKKAVSLWFKTSASGKEYINLCITDTNGEETWVAAFPNKQKKSDKSPDYTGVEFIKDGAPEVAVTRNPSPAPVAAVVSQPIDDIPF